jgi:hypothetical protein
MEISVLKLINIRTGLEHSILELEEKENKPWGVGVG